MDPPLPDEAMSLLRQRIGSFEQLEILLLLRQYPDQSWTADSVAERLIMTCGWAAEALDHLCRGNLLDVRVGGETLFFRYAPGTPELDRATASLAQAYSERRVDVMRALSANAMERVRTSAIRMFADAFLIGRGKKDG